MASSVIEYVCAMKFQSCGKGYSLPCLRKYCGKYMQNFRHLIGEVFRNEKECKDKRTGSVSRYKDMRTCLWKPKNQFCSLN